MFFNEGDYRYYLQLVKHNCDKENVDIWAYCLMTNHVHLIVKPNEDSILSKAIGETHKQYTRMVNTRERLEWLLMARQVCFVSDG
ncbi:transposase [Candidatus Spongiihabitans sp.]|uniref:transposase n=1 Tax=Candidatus Spongiihabitans sp. TaxID=3101308 RepID=UPI003C7C516E